ncbi:DUF4974 domain-containing protein [Mariniphaga sediminis]|uniref:DUF4974 domain-containing protein n=1 Tax=Mariniphaga sediminis TaxID=1628158 RepID=A0A399CXV6_9BACT|nr:FecR family protein [Mariniphaga sediminis]RIH63993.1 DUF4974 domain-containing protein [Mariniphaga sediminis]
MRSNKSIKAIIINHLEGSLSGEELKRLHQWLARSDDNRRYYSRIKDLWESSVSDADRFAETDKEWGRFLARVTESYQYNIFRFKTNFQIFYRFAAILIIGLIVGALVMNYIPSGEPLHISSMAPKGSISQMVLDDSTIVFLNADSKIRYSRGIRKSEREIFLEGEAWFNVAKNKSRTFIVHTSTYDVQVTGTKFNVKSYEEENKVITTLEEGRVVIASSKNCQLNEPVIMKPGEQVVLDKLSNEISVRKVDPSVYSSWKDNKLIFLNMKLDELVVLLEREYGVDIEVDDLRILKYHYTGTIKNETIIEILEIIKNTLPIEYNIEGQTIHIQNKGVK